MEGIPFYGGTLQGRPVCVVEGGMGTAAASRATRALITETAPSLVNSAGVCGALRPEQKVADLVVSRQLCAADEQGLHQIPLAGGELSAARLSAELQSKGIVVQASSILFMEHHDPKSIQEDIDWVISLGSDLVQFMNFTPMPTTRAFAEYEAQGRMRMLPYRHMHGQGQLNFDHPHFKDPKDHVRITREAFRKKYKTHGPGVLSMAMTAVRGYRQAQKDFDQRREMGLAWNPETCRYEKMPNPTPDRFMKQRIRMMRRIALTYRPALRAAWVFAPNRAARKKAAEVIRLYTETFANPKLTDRVQSAGLVVTGAIELVRLLVAKLRGRESIVRQPPCRRTEYNRRRIVEIQPEKAGTEAISMPIDAIAVGGEE